jgi:1-acyl-sn-glycerol-3-phosphate acyltransferase
MQGPRQQIILEFFEKVFAVLAFGSASALSPIALFPLAGRRIGWRQRADGSEIARILAYREIAVFFALAVGVFLKPQLQLIPFDPIITATFFLVLSIGLMLLAERSTAALIPKLHENEWTGPALRNLFGWAVLGITLTSFGKTLDQSTLFACCLIALTTATIPMAMAFRRGEPGLLIPGAFVALLGITIWNPWIAAAGFGWVIPCAVQITHNVKGSFALRSIVCWLGLWAGLHIPAPASIAAMAILFVLTLEMWRFVLRLMVYFPLRTLHRFKVYGSENYAADGPGMLLSNHVTMIDGWLLGAMTQRMVRFLAFDAYFKNPVVAFGLNLFRSISISQGARREAIESLRKARTVIEEGHFAGIFPEGGITRSGHLQPFQKGFTRIVSGTQIPIIPAYMNGLWTNLLSFSESKVTVRIGRFFRPLEIEFGKPQPPTISARDLWRVVKSLEVNAAFRDAHHAPLLPVAFLESARKHAKLIAVRAGGQSISYGDLATKSLLFARHINRRLRRKARIGIFLPDGIEKTIAHIATILAGHVAMDIPDLKGSDLDQFITSHGLGTLITSQSWIDSHDVSKADSMVFIGRALEKFETKAPSLPARYLTFFPNFAWRQVCTFSMRKDSAGAIVSSPRGAAVLSHRGIWSAAWAARRVLWWKPGVAIHNRVSLSRPASLTLGFWMPLLNGATLVFENEAVDFELVDAPEWQSAHPDSKHVLVIDPTEELGERYLPILELAEASGVAAISSPPVDFMGEVQSGMKSGTFGQMPFGLELEETSTGIRLRSPSRLLRYLDAGEAKVHSRIDDWLEVDVPLSLTEHWFVELKSTSELQTSSTTQQHQSSSHPQGE